MPRGNRTGPMGAGPRSGRAAGYCASYDTPGFMNRFFGRGSGMGYGQGFGPARGVGNRGGGFGYRRPNQTTAGFGRQSGHSGWMRFSRFFGRQPNPDAATEKQFLENEIEVLKSQLDQIQKRLSELDAVPSED